INRTLVCAKESELAARNAHSTGLRFGSAQKLLDFMLIGFLGDKADVHRGDPALAVNHNRGGQGVDAAEKLGDLIVAKQHAVIHLVLFDVGLHGIPSVLIHRDAEDGEVAVFVSLLEFHKPGDFDFAGSAPGGPEVQQYDFAFVIRELDGGPGGVFQREIGRWLTFPLGSHVGVFGNGGRAGNQNGNGRGKHNPAADGTQRQLSRLHVFNYTGTGARRRIWAANQRRRVFLRAGGSVYSSCRRNPAHSQAAVSQKLSQA